MFAGRSSAFEIAKEAVRWGVGGLELMNFCDELREPDIEVAKEIGRFAKGAGLKLPCFSVGINLFCDNNRDQIEKLKRYADICAELEIPYLHHTVAFALTPSVLATPFETVLEVSAAASNEVYEYARSVGVQTIVEDQGYFINGIENYTAFRNATDGNIGVLLDVGNIMFMDEKSEDFCAKFADEINHVHIKDYYLTDAPMEEKSYKTKGGMYLTNAPIGLGHINIDRTISILEGAGYCGHYSLEFSGGQTDSEIERILSHLCDSLVVYN